MGFIRRTVILYGDSLILEGVRSSLKSCQEIDLWELREPAENVIDIIQALCPAVFIFDISAIGPDFQFLLLKQNQLTLIGIDPETHQALVWSGKQENALDTSDLIRMVQ